MNNFDMYDLLNTGTVDKLIRHYKIIKRNNYNSTVNKEVDSNNEVSYIYNDELSQDIDDYDNKNIIEPVLSDNIYKTQTLISHCDNHNKYVLNGTDYDDLNDLKNDINNKNVEANTQYVNDILNNNFSYSDMQAIKNAIRKYINGESNHLYIRMAPDKEEKESLLKRLYDLQDIEPSVGLNGTKHYLEDGIPVYNDNIIYSNLKYETIVETPIKTLLGSVDESLNKKIEEL